MKPIPFAIVPPAPAPAGHPFLKLVLALAIVAAPFVGAAAFYSHRVSEAEDRLARAASCSETTARLAESARSRATLDSVDAVIASAQREIAAFDAAQDSLYKPDPLMKALHEGNDVLGVCRPAPIAEAARGAEEARSRLAEYEALRRMIVLLKEARIPVEGRPAAYAVRIAERLQDGTGLVREDLDALLRLGKVAAGLEDPFSNPEQLLADAEQIADAADRFSRSDVGRKAAEVARRGAAAADRALEYAASPEARAKAQDLARRGAEATERAKEYVNSPEARAKAQELSRRGEAAVERTVERARPVVERAKEALSRWGKK